jgi:membrane-associated phospholipid phosphatase
MIKTLLFLIFLIPIICRGQNDSLRKQPDVLRFIDGVAFTFSSPARWDGKDFLTLGGVIGGTALLTLADEPIRKFWQKQDSKFLDGVEEIGFPLGKPYAAYIVTGGFYLTGLVIKDKWAKDTGLILGTALLCSGAIQTVMKTAVGRARPGTEKGEYEFDPFNNTAAYHSFPSGHYAVAMTISTVLAVRVKSPVLKILFYTISGAVAISRMYSDDHWFSDIAFGGALGWFCSRTAQERIDSNSFKPRKDKHISWKVTPTPGGLSLKGNF